MSRALLALLLDVTLKGVVVLLFAFGLEMLLRRAAASLRHLGWTLAMAGLVALPLLVAFLPTWQLPILPQSWALDTTEVWGPRPSIHAQLRLASEGGATPVAGAVHAAALAGREPWLSWTTGVVAVWMLVAALVLARGFLGELGLRFIRRGCAPIADPTWHGLLAEVRGQLGIRRRVILLESHHAVMPMTWGVVRPVVLLPDSCSGWDEAKRRLVLLHELSHVRRLDHWTQWLARIACALHWWNPLVWFASARMRLDRERACDDRVLALGCAPLGVAENVSFPTGRTAGDGRLTPSATRRAKASDYAALLLEMSRDSSHGSALWSLVALPIAAAAKLETRLLAMLDTSRDRRLVPARLGGMLMILAACVWTFLAVMHPATPREARRHATARYIQEAGRTPLMLAVVRDDVPSVKELLRHGVEVNERAGDGATALTLAVAGDHEAVARVLLERGADPFARDPASGAPPLMAAARNGNAAMARILLENRADVNSTDREGYTALMLASVHGYGGLMRMLLERGADPNARAKDGFTALLGAVASEKPESVEALLRHGADVNAGDAEGWTPLKLAKHGGGTAIVSLLQKAGAKDA